MFVHSDMTTKASCNANLVIGKITVVQFYSRYYIHKRQGHGIQICISSCSLLQDASRYKSFA